MEKENKKNPIAFILMVVGVIFILAGSYIGTVFSIIALIISIIKTKEKYILNTIALIGSILIIIYSIISFIIAFNAIKSVMSESKTNLYKNYEQIVENEAKDYSYSLDKTTINDNEIVLKTSEFSKYLPNYCTGYVIWNIGENSYKPYIKCDGKNGKYTTEGINESLLKGGIY